MPVAAIIDRGSSVNLDAANVRQTRHPQSRIKTFKTIKSQDLIFVI